ncbi:hypothetical protein GIB67_021585 [Kingdonia uniflora]|uniref:Uncharacterized protein n=1 Tax=Kingdonia uniflora TaxID=39325 RepID=A0A7J7MDW3_9MAGN|nr:hypothetical protein GIB67_021585 [Kingdonia uniflora]
MEGVNLRDEVGFRRKVEGFMGNLMLRGRRGVEDDNAKLGSTSKTTGVGLHKIFGALPEEENGVLRTTFFVPLLLIYPIVRMSTLVAEIFDHHRGDMKFQFGGTIIKMKPIHVCLILGLRVSPISDNFLFVDPEYITNFRMRRFPKKKNTYGLKEIDGALKQAKLERYHDDFLRLNLFKILLSFLLLNKRRNIEWMKGPVEDEEPKAKSVQKEQLQVVEEEEVQEMEDSEQQTVVMYYIGKKDVVEEANETMEAAEVAKTEVVFFH